MFAEHPKAKLLGVHTQYQHETLTIAHLLGNQHFPVVIGPLQNEEIDIGETLPARCLRQGLWLIQDGTVPVALVLSPAFRFGHPEGTHIEIAVPPGESGSERSRRLFDELEALVRQTASYRGKVISLESPDRYSGHQGPLRVHKLRKVQRNEVVLPEKTLQHLDRNISDFVRQRERLRKLGLPIKKGLLFYGPPGTGKTHTIHYLAGQLPDHTTLLVTAEQVALLDHYFQLARFLQPAMIVIEDVDLIARARETMYGPCDESILNKLLNEMDGLREDAAVLFILTTNRPDSLEAALASRPGRIDQAIEFPLSDPQNASEMLTLRESIRNWRFYDQFGTDADSPVRSPQLGTWTPILGNDGSDVAAAMQTIREIGADDLLVAAIEDAFPGSRVSVENVEGRFTLTMSQHGLLRPLGTVELSDGTLRYLLWIAALLTPRPPAVMVLNEPETSLHPDLLGALGRLIARAAERTQIIVVTHSKPLIAGLSEQSGCNSIMLEKTFGETVISGMDNMSVPAWQWPSR